MARLDYKPRSKNNPDGALGTGCACIFFFIFLCFGLVFIYFISTAVYDQAQVSTWDQVPCKVLESSATTKPPYKLELKYQYTYNNKTYTSSKITTTENKTFDDYEDLTRLWHIYHKNATATCFVNPDDPTTAVLTTEDTWMFGLFILLPFAFICIGAGGIIITIRSFLKKKSNITQAISTPKSNQPATSKKAGCIFYSAFFIIGSAAFIPLFVNPMLTYLNAGNWQEAPATVLNSRVQSHSGDDGTTYSVDILYEYTFNNKTYRSNQYNFASGSSSGRSGKSKIVRQYPRGKKITCFVNPDDPFQATITRELSWFIFIGLIPLIFVIIGLVGIVYSLTHKPQTQSSQPSKRTDIPSRRYTASSSSSAADIPHSNAVPDIYSASDAIDLKSSTSTFGALLGTLFFAAFWNGIVSVFVFIAYDAWASGKPEWFLNIFLIPFVLVGLFIIFAFLSEILKLFNPKPTLTVNSDTIALGDPLDIAWEIKGRSRSIKKFTITLQCREEATYRHGTNTRTDNNTLLTLPIFESENHLDFAAGAASIDIPENAIHSFNAPNNKIIWAIHITGQIPRWPDIEHEYQIQIAPKPIN